VKSSSKGLDWRVRLAREGDRERLLEVWERSVRATHRFLTAADVVDLRPVVAQELAGGTVEWWVLQAAGEPPIGFLGFATNTIEALFVDPDYQGRGGGRFLVAHAQSLAAGGALSVDVNEQNEAGVEFYTTLGFSVVGRSPTDAGGRPFPLLHMRRAAPTPHLRIARPVSDLTRTRDMYSHGLGLRVLGAFQDHDGFDGVMLGMPGADYHFEFTRVSQHPLRPSPTVEDLLVLYVPAKEEWLSACARMVEAGFKPVRAFNPYWDVRGRTYEDGDGYRIVLERANWHDASTAA
jgi:GNAT superfamily N-acetyltransferase/catechol 2,3-dioxygenase-like lactoylglutathione lyase family enzyme